MAVVQANGDRCPLREIQKEVLNTEVTSSVSSLDALIGQARRDTDMQGQNEGELPVMVRTIMLILEPLLN